MFSYVLDTPISFRDAFICRSSAARMRMDDTELGAPHASRLDHLFVYRLLCYYLQTLHGSMGLTLRVLIWSRIKYTIASYRTPPLCKKKKSIPKFRKFLDNASPFTASVFMNFGFCLTIYTKPLPAIVCTTVWTTFCVLGANYVLRSPFDVIVTAAVLLSQFIQFTAYDFSWKSTLCAASKPPGRSIPSDKF